MINKMKKMTRFRVVNLENHFFSSFDSQIRRFPAPWKKCCSQRELHQLCIFSSNFRNNLLCFDGEENISAKGCIKIEPKLIFSSQSIF